MKKWLFPILAVLLAAPGLGAQNASRIRLDTAYLQGEGQASTLHAADSAALTGLAMKIAARSGLSPALGATYLEDLRRISSRIVEGRYTVLRYLRADETGTVFVPRQERVRQLVVRAEKTGDPQFYTLAYVLAQSIPDFPPDRLDNLRRQSSGTWSLEDFVSREAEAVLAALQPQVPENKPDKGKDASRSGKESDAATSLSGAAERWKTAATAGTDPGRAVVTDTVIVQRELGRIEVEHTFHHRDTIVVIPGFRKEISGAPEPKSRKKREPFQMQGFILAEAGIYPDLTGGLMLGLGGSVWGGYAGVRSNFKTEAASDYDCKSDGSTAYGQIWTSGRHRDSRISMTGGLWYHVSNPIRIYAGAGYGKRTVCWEDLYGDWARVTDYSGAGLALDAGVIWSCRHLSLSIGGEVIGFRQWGVQFGVGFNF